MKTERSKTSAPLFLKTEDLTPEMRQRLAERMSGAGDSLVFETGGIYSALALAAVSACWLGIVFYLADAFLWSSAKLVCYAALSLIAAYLLISNLYKLIRWFSSPFKNRLIVTRFYVIDVDLDGLRLWNLEELNNVGCENLYQNGSYRGTEVTLSFENAQRKLKIDNLEKGEEAAERISYFRKLFIEATARGDEEYLLTNDDFRDAVLGAEAQNGKSMLAPVGAAAAALLVAAAVMFGAAKLNNYFDDQRNWQLAQNAGRASAYRNYLQKRPDGRWVNEARSRLQNLYDEAENKYRAALNQDYDQKAVDAVVEVLRYARETGNYQVRIAFERHNEIPADIAERLKEYFEVKKVIEIGDSFADEKMSARETDLLALIGDAFRQVIPDDILEFSADCPSQCVTFLVKYTIDSDTIYYDAKQKDAPEDEIVYKPGIYFLWEFGVEIPQKAQAYGFELESNPAQDIYYTKPETAAANGDKQDFWASAMAERNVVYDAMIASAFDDFKVNLIYQTGIGSKPLPAEEKTDGEVLKATEIKGQK